MVAAVRNTDRHLIVVQWSCIFTDRSSILLPLLDAAYTRALLSNSTGQSINVFSNATRQRTNTYCWLPSYRFHCLFVHVLTGCRGPSTLPLSSVFSKAYFTLFLEFLDLFYGPSFVQICEGFIFHLPAHALRLLSLSQIIRACLFSAFSIIVRFTDVFSCFTLTP